MISGMDDARLANLLGALAVGVGDALHATLVEASGLDPAAVAALLVVYERAGLSIGDLAVTLSLTHSGAVRAVNRLAGRGLVLRGSGRDGRSRGLRLSGEGQAVAGQVLRARRERLRALTAAVPEPRRAQFADAVAAVLAALPASQVDARRICRVCEHATCRGSACPVGAAAAACERVE
jgi:DNA-binding MarR family transcriptional regulator